MDRSVFENTLLKYTVYFDTHDNKKQEKTGTAFH
jgi:hypothetical protein